MKKSETLELLHAMRARAGKPITPGLDDTTVEKLAADYADLRTAVARGAEEQQRLLASQPELVRGDEAQAVRVVQEDYLNFYSAEASNPYLAVAAQGPWVVTSHGAVIHDNGGYGMLGFGHNPPAVIKVLSQNQVMANIMTSNASQKAFAEAIFKEIGHSWRGKGRAFHRILCMNSGSEAMSVALRICDVQTALRTDPAKGDLKGYKPMLLSFEGSFHGRTERPAQASGSTAKKYEVLASFRDRNGLKTIPVNDVAALKSAFDWAANNKIYFEALLLEPVMGEGNPGQALSREFYDAARQITEQHKIPLIVDSIQAGLRAHGCLSIVDYPGFETATPPDMESYSKAINAGQYPLSVLALSQRAADLYKQGIYGNTMTTNPRALDVACAVLKLVTPELRQNIVERGAEFVKKLEGLKAEFPDFVTRVQGTGLLVAAYMNPAKITVEGKGQLEESLRKRGVGVIHGGVNALRFTPHFAITSAELDLIVTNIRDELRRAASAPKVVNAK